MRILSDVHVVTVVLINTVIHVIAVNVGRVKVRHLMSLKAMMVSVVVKSANVIGLESELLMRL